jgi:hypothetical protein
MYLILHIFGFLLNIFLHTTNSIQFNSLIIIIIIIIIQFFIIYVPSQQLQGQLQTQHSVDTGNYIMDKHNIKRKRNYRKLMEDNTLMENVN